jgi:branched-subunit amino acid transport protein
VKDTTLVVAGMATLAAGTYAFRLSGQVLRAKITFPPRATRLLEAAAVILLAALVATTALTEGHGFSGFARPAGVLLAGVLAWRKAPFLVVVLAAAAVTALLRLAGVSLGLQVALHGFHLRGERAGHPRPDVRLEHQADPRRPGRDGIHGPLDHRHGLVPVTLDGGEHGIGLVRQPALPHHPDGLGHHLADPLPDPERGNRKRNQHRVLPSLFSNLLPHNHLHRHAGRLFLERHTSSLLMTCLNAFSSFAGEQSSPVYCNHEQLGS